MTQQQMDICDGFVYIPQYGPGTASLNVACAASIVLHHFAVWSGQKERAREGYK
jgi:tRNA G18 (ribose-2'-O)-methylase SpoU